MITVAEIEKVGAAATLTDARVEAFVLMTRNASDDRKAVVRAKLCTMGTKKQIIAAVWEQMLNNEGWRVGAATQKAYKGFGYAPNYRRGYKVQ